MAKVTVQSIADRLELSKFAVSRALSGKPGVSEETRKLVISTAKELGYRAPLGRVPEKGAVKVILRSIAEANREQWLDVRNGLEMQAIRDGVNLEFVHTDDPGEIERLAPEALAYFLIGPNSSEVIERAHASQVYTLFLGHAPPPLMKVDQVTTTDEESGAAIGEFLLAKGHRDIAYVFGQRGLPGREARLHGLQQAVQRVPDARTVEVAFSDDYSASELLPAVRDLVSRGFNPTAFFCGSDGVAVTVQSELHRLGMRVPDDCSVVGHGDYPLATQVTPNLTTIHVSNREVGVEAIKLFGARLGQSHAYVPPNPVRIAVVDRLIERDSAGPVGSPNWNSVVGSKQD